MHHFLMMLDIPELTRMWDEPGTSHGKIRGLLSRPRYISQYEWFILLNRSFKIVFVRHPFVRLFSAFQDKVIEWDEPQDHYFKKMLNNTNLWSRKFRTDPDIPTFHEFAELLLLHPEVSDDEHARPYWKNCNFCIIDYDVIGKIETSKEDTRYIFEKKGLQEKLKIRDKIHATGKNLNKTTEERALEYFQKLNKSTVVGIYERYKIDFEMFGYTVNEYL